jgi:hypothetical protein
MMGSVEWNEAAGAGAVVAQLWIGSATLSVRIGPALTETPLVGAAVTVMVMFHVALFPLLSVTLAARGYDVAGEGAVPARLKVAPLAVGTIQDGAAPPDAVESDQ